MNRPINWERIESFVGFGSPQAKVLFLGFEEGLQREADLGADLTERSAYGSFEDLYEVQTALGTASKFFGPDPKSQRTWRPMCHLMLRLDGIASPTKEQRSRYQADRLGRRDGETLLAELYPYPSSSTQEWPYAERFRSRQLYYADMLEKRSALLRDVIGAGDLSLIVCYTKMAWPAYRAMLQIDKWQAQGDFEVGRYGDAQVVLSPAFSGRRFNTDMQLQSFSEIALN